MGVKTSTETLNSPFFGSAFSYPGVRVSAEPSRRTTFEHTNGLSRNPSDRPALLFFIAFTFPKNQHQP